MLTRRKNRVKKNGKKRYMSRKMRGGDIRKEFNEKFEKVIENIQLDTIKEAVKKIQVIINEFHNDIEEAIENIEKYKENNKNNKNKDFKKLYQDFGKKLYEYFDKISGFSLNITILKEPTTKNLLKLTSYTTKQRNEVDAMNTERDAIAKEYHKYKEVIQNIADTNNANLKEFKKFNAKRKMKAAIKAVIVMNKLSSLGLDFKNHLD
jgi:histidinol dehydrogenase